MARRELTIAISTRSDRIQRLRTWVFDGDVTYIVLWQEATSAPIPNFLPSNVLLIKLDSVGVAKSRNAAINSCNTKWLWFMDDDVGLPSTSIKVALTALTSVTTADVLIASVATNAGAVKSFGRSSPTFLAIMSVGTIQIICCAETAKTLNILFPENLGAGTEYFACDEPVFLFRYLTATRGQLVPIPEVVVIHPMESSGQNLGAPGALISRAILFREVFGFPLCVVASVYFYLRHIRKIRFQAQYLFHYLRAT